MKRTLTIKEFKQVDDFISGFPFTPQQKMATVRFSNPLAFKSRQWYSFTEGHTSKVRVITWYQIVYRPGSTDCRPNVIREALLEEIGIDE